PLILWELLLKSTSKLTPRRTFWTLLKPILDHHEEVRAAYSLKRFVEPIPTTLLRQLFVRGSEQSSLHVEVRPIAFDQEVGPLLRSDYRRMNFNLAAHAEERLMKVELPERALTYTVVPGSA